MKLTQLRKYQLNTFHEGTLFSLGSLNGGRKKNGLRKQTLFEETTAKLHHQINVQNHHQNQGHLNVEINPKSGAGAGGADTFHPLKPTKLPSLKPKSEEFLLPYGQMQRPVGTGNQGN